MKKSPLSTPGANRNNFQGGRGRGRNRGYDYNQMRSDDNFRRYHGSNHSQNNQFENDLIPLDSSSPVYHHNHVNKLQSNDKRNLRFSNTGISSSYINQRNSPTNSFSPQKYQRNHQQQRHNKNNDPDWHRRLPMTEYIDLKSVFENPWSDLEIKFTSMKYQKIQAATNDSSVEILFDRNQVTDSSIESTSIEATVNLSSSSDEVKESSSVDLALENMTFNSSSKDVSILGDNATTGTEDSSKYQTDSVIEITS